MLQSDVNESAAPTRSPRTGQRVGIERGGTTQLARWIRILSHASIWTVVIAPVIIQIERTWSPINDNAVIALGASRVFTAHSPLVGVWTSASQGSTHAYFDLGPLLFWLLAVPVHLDPTHGALWGAALCSGLMLSATVEALWSVDAWVGCGLLAILVIDLARLIPSLDDNLMWNPNIGLAFLITALALAWVVAVGSAAWWPLLVFAGSVAAQCHLTYVALAVLLVIGAPLFSLRRPQAVAPNRRWLWYGIGVGAVCWLAPFIQEVTGNPGNLTLLANSRQGSPTAGVDLGLEALTWAGSIHPIWLNQYPTLVFLIMTKYIGEHSVLPGLLITVAMVAIVWWAWTSSRIRLAALAGVGLIACVGVIISFSSVPQSSEVSLGYVVPLLWVVGSLIWIVGVWTLAIGGINLWRAFGHRRRTPEDATTSIDGDVPPLMGTGSVPTLPPTDPTPQQPRTAGLTVAAAVIAFVALTALAVRAESINGDRPQLITPAGNQAAVSAIERLVPSGPVAIRFTPTDFVDYVDVWGIAYQLAGDGRITGLPAGRYAAAMGLPIPKGDRWPTVVFTPSSGKSYYRIRLVPARTP